MHPERLKLAMDCDVGSIRKPRSASQIAVVSSGCTVARLKMAKAGGAGNQRFQRG